MTGTTIPLAFALISAVFAYLSINTPQEYASLQIGNYLLTYITIVFTGFLSYSYAASGENAANVLAGWNNSFYFVLILVVAVFLIKMLNAVLEETGREVLN